MAIRINNNDRKSSFLAKNRYEILFFNKETLCTLLYITDIININNIIEETTKKNNIEKLNANIENNKSKISNETVIKDKSTIQNLASIIYYTLFDQKKTVKKYNTTQSIPNEKMYTVLNKNKKQKINININLKTEHFKEKYNILNKFCYARMYFRYSNNDTFLQRFKKKGNKNKKNFNYIKKYNSFTLLNLFKEFIIQTIMKNYGIDRGLIINYYNKYGSDTIKKLTNDDNRVINDILNRDVENEKAHYENIKDALDFIKKKTDNFIDYCIVLDIKKYTISNINSIKKKTDMYINKNDSIQYITQYTNTQYTNTQYTKNTQDTIIQKVIYNAKMTLGLIIIIIAYIFSRIMTILSLGQTYQGKSVGNEIMNATFNILRKHGIYY